MEKQQILSDVSMCGGGERLCGVGSGELIRGFGGKVEEWGKEILYIAWWGWG